MTCDLSKTGTIGNPSTASVDKGQQMLEALATAWAQIIEQLYAFQFPH
jgi:creatinine amidohydrolase